MLEICRQGERKTDINNRDRKGDKRRGRIPPDGKYSSGYKEVHHDSGRGQKITVISCEGDRLLVF